MIGEIAVVPQVEGSARALIAGPLAEITDQGLHYELGPLGTCVEGNLDAVRAIEHRLSADGNSAGSDRAATPARAAP
jgi:uncharacterized protein YqgV (UPF0045/DUF77 family)